jgi:hypothetical protein
MKRILVAFACAAGMLLVLSSSCDDFTSAGGKGSKGASGLDRLPSPYPCDSGGGSGSAQAEKPNDCSADNNYIPSQGACFQVSGGYVVISFSRHENNDSYRVNETTLQFLILEEDFAETTYSVPGEATFRAKQTGKTEDVYDSDLCQKSCGASTITVTSISQPTPEVWADGDTINVSWDAAAYMVEEGGCCDNDYLASDGSWSDIPYM